MNSNKIIKLRNTRQANKKDLCITLAYFQDALEVATSLRSKLERMPIIVRQLLEDKGANLDAGEEAEFMFRASINYIESLIDCIPQHN